jgi:hypothetical protein
MDNDFADKTPYPCDGMYLHSLHDATIRHNKMDGLTGTGIVFVGSPWGNRDVEMASNTIVNCGRAKPDAFKTSIFVDLSGSATIPPLPFHAENIKIISNALGNTESSAYESSGMTLAALAPSKLKGFYVKDNTFLGVRVKLSDGHKEIGKLETLNPEAHSDP